MHKDCRGEVLRQKGAKNRVHTKGGLKSNQKLIASPSSLLNIETVSNYSKTINPLKMADLFMEENRGAIFSSCRKYRYVLWRQWDKKPFVTFIGLNPSTANESQDDPTIRRVMSIAKNLGFGGIYMMNLFGIISADPKVLQTCADPVGENDKWLKEFATEDIIFAWGNFKEATERAKHVAAMFPNGKALFINKNGTPKHPLYCKADIQPVMFNRITER